jgi:hypothetical protein
MLYYCDFVIYLLRCIEYAIIYMFAYMFILWGIYIIYVLCKSLYEYYMRSKLVWLPRCRRILKPFKTYKYDGSYDECYEADIFDLVKYEMKSSVYWYNMKYICENYGSLNGYRTNVRLYPEGDKYKIYVPHGINSR